MLEWKRLFNRIGLVAIAILVQILIMLGLLTRLYEYFPLIQVFMFGLSIVVLLNIVNRDMPPETRIPWIIVVLMAPVVGTLFYLLFSRPRLTTEQKNRFRRIYFRSKPYFHRGILPQDEFLKEVGKYAGQISYIHRVTGQVAFLNTDVEYFAQGEDFFAALVEELKKAERFIFMEYFIVTPGVMWNTILGILEQKTKAGIEVRFMYDDLGSAGSLPANYHEILEERGIICVRFNPFKPVVSEDHNNRDHRKITVIDGRVGFVGGANLSDEYINEVQPYGHWKDTAVNLVGPGVRGLTLLFLQNFNTQCMYGVDDFDCYIPVEEPELPENGMVMPYGDGPRPAYPDYVAENVYLNMINQAERYIWITTPYLIPSSLLMNALCNAAMRGVDVRVVTPHIPDKRIVFAVTRSNYRKLLDCGVKIFEYTPGFIHAKQFLCDDDVTVVGSINLDYRSLVHHWESALWMYRTSCLADMKADFEQLFTQSENMDGYRQHRMVELMCRIMHPFVALL